MMLMLVGMTAWAQQDWTAPGESDYLNSTPVYVQVNINGAEQWKAEVAAFIDGECRAVAYGAGVEVGNQQLYELRVWGNNTDLNKTITFKVKYADVVYAMTKTITFTGETYTPIPLELNVDIPTGVILTNPLEIEQKLPFEYDLTNDVTFIYQGYEPTGAPVDYEPLGESTIETALTYEWNTNGFDEYFTVKGMTLMGTKETPVETSVYLSLNIIPLNLAGRTQVVISEPEVPVTGITCNLDEFTLPIWQSLLKLGELTEAITITPVDASNQNYYFEGADDNARSAYNKEDGIFNNPGLYQMKVVSEFNPEIFATFSVEVVQPVESLSLTSTTFYAIVNDNIKNLVSPSVQITPENATNQEFYIEYPSDDAFTNDVVYMPGEYTINVVSADNNDFSAEATLYVIAIDAPTSLEMEMGENYNDLLTDKITIDPQICTWDILPAETDAVAFENGVATQAGTYTLVVTCKECDRAKAEIIVTVKEPVTITFPALLTISKLRDTELTLEITSGSENFDADLLDIQITGEVPEGLSLPSLKEVENSNGLKWNIRGYAVGRYLLTVFYNEKPMTNTEDGEESTVALPTEIPFNNAGWDWIYYPSYLSLKNYEDGSYLTWLNQDANNRVIEIRSQTELLYNDATLGLFGSLNELGSYAGMYKIKAVYEDAADAVIMNPADDCFWTHNGGYTNEIVKGYNWIGYPNEWGMTVADLNTVRNIAYDGDMIIGKTGFAEYDASSNTWISENDFSFQPGKGYLYYCTNETGIPGGFSFNFTPKSGDATYQSVILSAQKASAESVWQYDAGQFADNMAIVAEIPQLDFPADYTVGAFVGDECRGKGSAVLGSKMMICVAGKAGEHVTFRLHNELTGEFIDLNETLTYAQRAGSLKKPVVLTSDGITTNIAENIAPEAAVEGIFDLSGRQVEKMNASGVYIVKTLQNGKIVAKKVVKK